MSNAPTDPRSSAIRRAPRAGDVVDSSCSTRGRGCGCGPDLGPIADHEGPSEADLERFSDPTRLCPDCKTEVYDEAELCWNCGHAFRNAPGKLPTWVFVAAGLVIAGFFAFLFTR